VTIRRNGFIGYTLTSGLQCNGWCCKNLSSRSFYIQLEEGRKGRRYNTTRPWGSTKSRNERVRPKVGKDRVWIFILWEEEMEMRWCLSTPGSAEHILPVTLSTSVTPVCQYNRRRSLKMYLIERVWDPLGDGDQMNSEMHLEAGIKRIWRCTWRPRSSWLRRCTRRPWSIEFGDELWGCDQASLEIHLQAMINRDWRSAWRRSISREARRELRLYSFVNL